MAVYVPHRLWPIKVLAPQSLHLPRRISLSSPLSFRSQAPIPHTSGRTSTPSIYPPASLLASVACLDRPHRRTVAGVAPVSWSVAASVRHRRSASVPAVFHHSRFFFTSSHYGLEASSATQCYHGLALPPHRPTVAICSSRCSTPMGSPSSANSATTEHWYSQSRARRRFVRNVP
jgi:hypothetical protein